MSAEVQVDLKTTKETFLATARHIEGTEMCMLTLPCKFTDKRVRFTVEIIGE